MNTRMFLRVDIGLLAPVLILVILSLTTLLSVDISYFINQLVYCFLSLIIFFFFSKISFPTLRHYALPIYIISLILLFFVLLLGIESRGAVRWIDILGVRVQFSEILKPFLAISLASFFSGMPRRSIGTFFLVFVFVVPVAFLVFLQPDLGNAVIYGVVTLLVAFIVGFPLWLFVAGFILSFLLVPLVWPYLHEYQRQRIITFFHPSGDPLGTSYNAIQAIIAVGSGMLFGKGLSQGTQSTLRFLPERHTDFIFATLSEGLGLVGATIVIGAFAFLCFRIYMIMRSTDETFEQVFCILSILFFLVQPVVNIGMNIGMLPIVGVTLPFVSYGGSSLLSSFIFLGLLSAISDKKRTHDVLAIR